MKDGQPIEPPPAIAAALQYAGQLHMGGLSLTSALIRAAHEYSEQVITASLPKRKD